MDTLVVGASGLVGSEVTERFRDAGHEVTGTYHTTPADGASVELDKTNPAAVSDVVSARDPDVVVDTAAFHDVDRCEHQREQAWAVNAGGTRNVATAAEAATAHYLFISTDYVFGGRPGRAPYTESASVSPVNYYGATKYAGEQAAAIPDQSTVLRTSVVYGVPEPNFLTWLVGELEEGPVGVVEDQVGSPTYAGDVAEACLRIARRGLTGLYHAGGPEALPRHEFASRLAAARGYEAGDVTPVRTADLDWEVPRPSDSSLDSTALYDAVGYRFRDVEAACEELPPR